MGVDGLRSGPLLEGHSMPRTNQGRRALVKLASLAEKRWALDRQIADTVGVCRQTGLFGFDEADCSWSEVGEALGVTKQAAQQKYSTGQGHQRRRLADSPIPADGSCPVCARRPASRHADSCCFEGHVPRSGWQWSKEAGLTARAAGFRVVQE